MSLVNTVGAKSTVWRWLLPVLVVLLVGGGWMLALLLPLRDPYIQAVRAAVGNPSRGEQIFILNCAGCHGIDGKGEVGPSLVQISHRRSQVQLIQQIISGNTPPMPKFQAQPQDMADLLSYLKTL
ncbi:cytochrome cM CytM [Thermosynechococcus sp. NK55a]|jgi:mono/diheme cytochrome c family protein|uniref:c-type cytochrome n=1 Tax=unclassified Thermosynechococcus TaxID=2622553 RepID=UPI0003D923CB|nr:MULTISPECIES: cytochrome c [unclassified Thermosynechococcus]AHB87767.1 cytochrome cM CytM [Thermosynechococcus sp. NK55a]HIK22212.1 cytochrome c [Thermosynechococcus sp. M3746_W2019_013]